MDSRIGVEDGVELKLFLCSLSDEEGSVNSDADLMSSIGEDRVNDCDNLYGSMWSLNSASVTFESTMSNSQDSSKYDVQSEMQMR